MRTEEEVQKELSELGAKYNILENSDSENMWQFWEEERKLREELQEIEYNKKREEKNSPDVINERKKQWKERQNKNLIESGIGQRYLSTDINSFICNTADQVEILNTVKQFISKPIGKNLWLVGTAGTGKTLLAAIICRYCGAKYLKSFQLKDELEYAKSFNAKKNPTEVINDYAQIPVLIIDEVGRYKSPQEQEYLFRLLNERYEMQKPTVLISNMNKKEFGEYLGNPIVDRFKEGCKCLEFKGESYRAKERNEWNGEIKNIIFEC